jgi:hypothetical protein
MDQTWFKHVIYRISRCDGKLSHLDKIIETKFSLHSRIAYSAETLKVEGFIYIFAGAETSAVGRACRTVITTHKVGGGGGRGGKDDLHNVN